MKQNTLHSAKRLISLVRLRTFNTEVSGGTLRSMAVITKHTYHVTPTYNAQLQFIENDARSRLGLQTSIRRVSTQDYMNNSTVTVLGSISSPRRVGNGCHRNTRNNVGTLKFYKGTIEQNVFDNESVEKYKSNKNISTIIYDK